MTNSNLIPLVPNINQEEKALLAKAMAKLEKLSSSNSSDSEASGMYQVMAAMLASIEAVQGYDANGLMPLSEKLLQTSQAWSNSYLGTLNTDMQKVQDDVKNHPDEVQADITTFNMHNTLYNQASTYYSGLTNGLNQNSSDTTQTVQVNLQMYESGPLSQLQTITQAL